MESYKLLSSDKKDDIKMDIVNHYRKYQFRYDFRNSDYINRDLWEHTQRQFAANLKCDGYADRQRTNNSTELLMQKILGQKIFQQSEKNERFSL